ncbi:3-hydroxyanthranilate 3,4-dioxygenase [Acinetobacter sp. WZC-1]|uniref:3-hydroxyanthranilate 3,4-dioxygenase n=1 Tax=Acinetobacter sp. WZC-1 TaxID=3459034 RepID=UPI00403D55BB
MDYKYGLPKNLKDWAENHSNLLAPPVCNAAVFENGDYFINMVGGPNFRTDFHDNPTEEIFYQMAGSAYVIIWDRNKFEKIVLKEGDIFVMPAHAQHSPQRPTPGLCFLVEHKRPEQEDDRFNWYCSQCATLVYSDQQHVHDLVAQLPPVYRTFYNTSDEVRTCPSCGYIHAGKHANQWISELKL